MCTCHDFVVLLLGWATFTLPSPIPQAPRIGPVPFTGSQLSNWLLGAKGIDFCTSPITKGLTPGCAAIFARPAAVGAIYPALLPSPWKKSFGPATKKKSLSFPDETTLPPSPKCRYGSGPPAVNPYIASLKNRLFGPVSSVDRALSF